MICSSHSECASSAQNISDANVAPMARASCPGCEVLPEPLRGPGILHLRFPLSHSRGKIAGALKSGGWQSSQEGGVLSIVVPEASMVSLATSLMGALSSVEQSGVNVLFQSEGQALGLSDYFRTEPLASFAARAQSGWLLDILREERLTSHFQPIVRCQSGEVFAYECLMRGIEHAEDGSQRMIPPGRMLDIGRGAGLLFQLDRAARLSAIRQAAGFGLQSKIFINFTPTAIYDPVNCLRSTVEAADTCGIRREQIVFEVIESEEVRDVPHLRSILDFYRAAGFEVALDDLGSGYSSLNLLSQLRPNYIKLDRELIRDITNDPFKATIACKMLEAAQALDIPSIAEGVETAEESDWLLKNGATFMQGYILARPASVPPLLLQQAA